MFCPPAGAKYPFFQAPAHELYHVQDYSELRVGCCHGKMVLSYAKLQMSDFLTARKMPLIKILKSKGHNIEQQLQKLVVLIPKFTATQFSKKIQFIFLNF